MELSRVQLGKRLTFCSIIVAFALVPRGGLYSAPFETTDRGGSESVQDSQKSKTPSDDSEPSEETHAVDEKPAEPTLAIVGATIHTMTNAGTIADGVVLVRGKKIVEVGDRSLRIPEGAEQVDVSGSILTPGLIDARSRLWLADEEAEASASDASLDALHGVNPFAKDWQEVIKHGVTSIYVQPGQRGTAGGYGAVLSVLPGELGPETLAAQAALQASFGIGSKTNRDRFQQFERTRKLLSAAEEYRQRWKEYREYQEAQAKKKEAAKTEGDEPDAEPDEEASPNPRKQSGRPKPAPSDRQRRSRSKRSNADVEAGNSRDSEKESGSDPSDSDDSSGDNGGEEKEAKPPEKPEEDPAKELLSEVLSGDKPLRLELQTANDLSFGIKLIEEFPDLQLVLDGLSDVRAAGDQISSLGVPVVLGPWLEVEPGLSDELESREQWIASFAEYDGSLVIGSFSASVRGSRWLRAHMSRAVAYGLDPERAIRAVTLEAARVLGVDDCVGSIAPGMRADLACFAGEPVDPSVPTTLVVSGGRIAYRNTTEAAAPESYSAASRSPKDLSISRLPTRFVLKSQAVLTEDGSVQPRQLLMQNGRVESVAKVDEQLDENLAVIDVGRALVTPGLFSAQATFDLEEAVDPESQADAAYVTAGDVFAGSIPRGDKRVTEGLLHALLAPGDSNPVAGIASLVALTNRGEVLERSVAAKLVLSSSARRADRYPSSLAGQMELIRESFSGDVLANRLYLPRSVESRMANARQLAFEAMRSGDRPALIVAESDAEIRAALDLIEEFELSAALAGARQLEPFIERLRSLQVTVIARPVSIADYDWYPADLALASAAGIPVCFGGETAEQLRLTAALCVAAGMDRPTARQALCHGPSRLVDPAGINSGLASGIVVWSADPLNLAAKPLLVIEGGKVNESVGLATTAAQ